MAVRVSLPATATSLLPRTSVTVSADITSIAQFISSRNQTLMWASKTRHHSLPSTSSARRPCSGALSMRCHDDHSWARKEAACISDSTKLKPTFIYLYSLISSRFLDLVTENLAPIGPFIVGNSKLKNKLKVIDDDSAALTSEGEVLDLVDLIASVTFQNNTVRSLIVPHRTGGSGIFSQFFCPFFGLSFSTISLRMPQNRPGSATRLIS